MLFHLNLLDKDQKNHLHHISNYRPLHLTAGVIIIGLALLGFVTNTAREKLNHSYEELPSAPTSIKNIEQLNTKLQQLNSTQNSNVRWSQVLIDLAQAVPTSIHLDSLNIEKNHKLLEINGQALTLADLDKLKNNLSKLNYLQIPQKYTYYLNTKNILNFQLKAFIKTELLPK